MTRDEIIEELRHVEKDLRAFQAARDAVQSRINELDHEPQRQEFFSAWAATQALMNVAILAIVKCEGLIDDYTEALERVETPAVVPLRRVDHER